MNKSIVTAPQASMLIWNYRERFNAEGLSNPHEVDLIYLLTDQVVSISTHKSKGRPAGRFEVVVAPTDNWISKLTPGSWCVINMTKDLPIPSPDSSSLTALNAQADGRMVKWLGRIEDVRVTVDVEQETGARTTRYVITGSDWSSVFNSLLYVDPIFRNSGLNTSDGPFTAIGAAQRFIYDTMTLDNFKKGTLPTSSTNVKGILRLWGSPLQGVTDSVDAEVGIDKLQLTSAGRYQLPKQVAKYLGIKTPSNVPTSNIADAISVHTGVLSSYDKYKPVKDAVGLISPDSIFGTNSVWQVLVDNSNPILNELVTDLRIETSDSKTLSVGGDTFELALYHRVKPFIVRTQEIEGGSEVKNFFSRFQNIKTTTIALEDVLNIECGISWNDMINFIEIKPDQQLNPGVLPANFKKDSQIFDKKSYERNGFRPAIEMSKYLPIDASGKIKAADLTKWKYLLKEWYFNQHNQLNGTVTFIGQNKHICVGDNIAIDSQVLGKSRNYNQFEKKNTSQAASTSSAGTQGLQKMILLAHVEGVRHSFGVNPTTGARSFTTTIDFVRGLIIPENGVATEEAMAIDKDATVLKDAEELTVDVVRTKTGFN